MYIANVFYVVYGTTLVRTKNKMSKSENQERKKRKTKYPNFKSKIWKTISIWISFKQTHLTHPQLITEDSFCPKTSLYIPVKLPTYPSPKQTLTLTTH